MIAETKPAGLPDATTAAPESPYKFLDYFTESPEDRRRFGGRDREIHDLVTRITNQRTLVLYGPSGIGKTSLLLAGVFPALRERGVRPVYVRLLTSPVADLLREVVATCDLSPVDPGVTLRDVLARATQGGRLALVLDQFEELFVRFRDQPKKRAAFISTLAEVINDRSLDITVVFSLREDYLANLDELARGLPDLLADRYRLPPLTPFGVRQAVSRPLVDAGVSFEPAVVSRLIVQLAEVDCEPSLLQILCSELYKAAVRRAGGSVPRITVADLESLGGRDGVFRRYLQSVADELPREHHLLARMVLDSLITPEGTKCAARLADILSSGFSAPESEVREILSWLVSRRLLRCEERSGETWYELVHERLVPLLREWLDLDRPFFEFRQARGYVRNTSAGELWRESPDTLLSAETLTNLLRPYRQSFHFSNRDLELVVRSALYRQSEELPFWAERYGLERTRGLLLAMFESGRDGERIAAVVSARRLGDPEGALARACLGIALEDPSEAVRRQAALSLAKLARPEEMVSLRAARRDPERRDRAKSTYANMVAGGHDLAGVGWLDKRSARCENRSRVLDEQGVLIRRRAWQGLKSGALAGFIWTLPRMAIVCALLLTGTSTDKVIDLAFNWLIICVELLILGGLGGWLTARAAARQVVVTKKEGGWVRALCLNPLHLTGWIVLCGITGALITGWGGASGWGAWAWVLGLWAFLSIIPVAAAQISRPFDGFEGSLAGPWLGSFFVSLGLSVVMALGVLASTWTQGGAAVECLGFLCFSVSVALVRSAARFPVPGALVPPAKKQIPIVLAVLGVAALIAVPVYLLWEYYHGRNTLLNEVQNLAWRKPVALEWWRNFLEFCGRIFRTGD